MTSTTLSPKINGAPSSATRVINVMRLHLVNKSQMIVTPWLIMSFIFSISLMIGLMFRPSAPSAITDDTEFTMEFNGALMFFLIYMLVLAVMAVSQVFPFSQSFSVTRRDFYAGTVLTFFSLSIAFSIVITVLSWIEDTTNGWGLNVSVFNPGIFGENLAERFFIMVVLFMFFFMTGIATASVYVRWKANGMYIFFGVLTLILVGLAWLATLTDSWDAVGQWFATMGVLGVVSWTLVPSALALVTGYLILRKSTPRD